MLSFDRCGQEVPAEQLGSVTESLKASMVAMKCVPLGSLLWEVFGLMVPGVTPLD